MIFRSGQWRTPESVEREREQDLKRARGYRANDPEYCLRQREYKRERWANDPEYRKRGLERMREYHHEHKKDPEYRSRHREECRKYRIRKKESGLCTCGQPLLSETRCWDCLNKQEEYRALAI